MSAGFEKLARPLQHGLWDLRWDALRPIQVDAIDAFGTDGRDLILSAATASGKTEAAFLPIFSAMLNEPAPGVRAMYIGPLKALINDQFGRLERLCQRAQLPVHRWHGDVGQSAKERLVRAPAGTLLITPESLESLLLNRTGHLTTLFPALDWVVIDEIHAFVGQPRGRHLRSLLHRLENRLGRAFRIIGLSATVGDAQVTARWFGPARAERVRLIEDTTTSRAVRLSVDAVSDATDAGSDSDAGDTTLGDGLVGVAERLISALPSRSSLVFCNRKRDVEQLCDLMSRLALRQGSVHQYRVHHGSLARGVREDAEAAMKSGRPTTTLCSATLELGIDVGDVAAVGQLGAPFSVSNLIQRLGRSGRRDGEPSVLLLYAQVAPLDAEASLVDELSLDLVQAIALVELMLERWSEPPELDALDLSTLSHQVLALLRETGGDAAANLFEQLVRRGAFGVSPERFAELLRSLGAADLIEQAPDGKLILGLAGERVTHHYSFYAVFPTPSEFRVMDGSRHVGMIEASVPPAAGDHLLLAGRRWGVVGVDLTSMRIDVTPATGAKAPRFGGGAGQIHPRVHAMMRQVLSDGRVPAYLTKAAAERLGRARTAFSAAQAATTQVIDQGPETVLLLWGGSRVNATVRQMLRRAEISADDRQWRVGLAVAASRDRVRAVLREALACPPEPHEMAAGLPTSGKFDEFLSQALRQEVAVNETLDLPSTLETLRRLQDQL